MALACALHGGVGRTAEAPPAGDVAAAAAADAGDQPLESTRSAVRSTVVWLARGVDGWFGDKPFEEGGEVRDGRLSLGLFERHGDRTDTYLRFNARFRLPNVRRFSYLFVGRDNEREVVTDQPDTVTHQQRLLPEGPSDQSFFAGLGVALRENFDLRLGIRGGIKPYAQARYRHSWTLSALDLAEFRQTFFWTLADHLGSTTALSIEHAFTDTLAARWLNSGTITQDSRRFGWSSVAGLYDSFGAQRVLGLELLFSGTRGAAVPVSEYGLRAHWEQPVHKDWLLGEVIVGRFWTRADPSSDRRPLWGLGAGLRMKF